MGWAYCILAPRAVNYIFISITELASIDYVKDNQDPAISVPHSAIMLSLCSFFKYLTILIYLSVESYLKFKKNPLSQDSLKNQ